MYFLAVDGVLVIFMCTHVDDLIWAAKPEYRHIVKEILAIFSIKMLNQGPTYRFCGREIEQLPDKSIKVTCKANAEKILPINFHSGDRTDEDDATEGERKQLESVVGSLVYVARQAHIWMLYDTSKLQSVTKCARVKHLIYANILVAECASQSDEGLFYTSFAFDWKKKAVLSIGDASWAGETKVEEGGKPLDCRFFPRRSQYGRINLLAGEEIFDDIMAKVHGHFISAKSSLIRRLCGSTCRAETHGQMKSTGQGDYMSSSGGTHRSPSKGRLGRCRKFFTQAAEVDRLRVGK